MKLGPLGLLPELWLETGTLELLGLRKLARRRREPVETLRLGLGTESGAGRSRGECCGTACRGPASEQSQPLGEERSRGGQSLRGLRLGVHVFAEHSLDALVLVEILHRLEYVVHRAQDAGAGPVGGVCGFDDNPVELKGV